MKMTNVVIIVVLAILVAGGGGFYGGMKYQKGKQPSFPGGGNMRAFGNGNFGMRNNNGGNGTGAGNVRGTIESVNGSTLTVKSSDGSSKLVVVSDSTTVSKNTTGTITDLTTGQTIAAFGTTNTDGSVTATSVELNPSDRGMGAPPTGAAPAASN